MPPLPAAVAAFSRHGTYIEDTPKTIAQYGSVGAVVAAMQQAQMSHAWIRIHGEESYDPPTRSQIAKLIAALKAGGIAVAGWGWCQGDDPGSDAAVALSETSRFGLSAYIADIEPADETNWTVEGVQQFFVTLRAHFHGALGVTSFPLIDWHRPDLLKAALPYVDMVNPQVYWFHFPNRTMVNQYKKPNGSAYRADNAPDYTDLCYNNWLKLMGAARKNIVISGQAYWGESGITKTEVEAKVREFLAGWDNYETVVGYNWYSFGGKTTMSASMLSEITAARLGDKTYGP